MEATSHIEIPSLIFFVNIILTKIGYLETFDQLIILFIHFKCLEIALCNFILHVYKHSVTSTYYSIKKKYLSLNIQTCPFSLRALARLQ